MSVRPVAFNADGSIEMVYDEQGHSGTIPAAAVLWATKIDGTDSHQFIVLACPDGCGATSTHPVGGGAAPAEVQEMFVHKVEHDGCACGQVEPGRTDATPAAHTRLNVNRMDGPGRWKLDEGAASRGQRSEGTPVAIEVVYRESDGLVVGFLPSGDIGPDLAIAGLNAEQYAALMKTDPAYLDASGEVVTAAARGA